MQKDSKTNTKRKISLILTGSVLGVVMSFVIIGGPLLLLAQATTDNNRERQDTLNDAINSDSNCEIALKPFIAKEEQELKKFIDQTLKNKSDASVLIELATERYRQFRQKLLAEFAKYKPEPDADLATSLAEAAACRKMIDDSIAIADAIIRKQVVNNAQTKKTTKLVVKFQTLNTKLGELQREIGTMKGFWDSFNDKLPCFTKQCIR